MKLLRNLALGLAICSITFMQVGCFGAFPLVGKVHSFNNSLGPDMLPGRIIKEVAFLVMTIIPVYGVALFLDLFIFNLIEFWTGLNPIGMNSVQEEIQIVKSGGENFEITATQNQFHIVQLTGEQQGTEMDLVYNTTQNRWYKVQNHVAEIMPAGVFAELNLDKKAS